MANIKKATTLQEQIEILRSRGCKINNESFCIEKLKNINYYRLSAYLLPFKKGDCFKDGTTFDRIYHIYEFDRILRRILRGALEIVEISFQAKLSYLHGHKYGSLGYLDPDNFNKKHNSEKFTKNINSQIRQNKILLFVKHHLDKYEGKFPIWVIVELFSFGMLSYFYSDLHTEDQKRIAKEFNVNFSNLRSWLRCLTDLRNICAHSGRLYYRVFSASPAGLDLSEEVKRRLWGIILVLKQVFPSKEKWQKECIPAIENLFSEYDPYIDLYHIAFPEN